MKWYWEQKLLLMVTKRLYGGGSRYVVGGDFVVRDGGSGFEPEGAR